MHVVVLAQRALSGHVLLRTLRASGINVHLLCSVDAAALRWSSSVSDTVLVGDLSAAGVEAVAIINDLHRRFQIDAVMAADVEGLLLLARQREGIDPKIFPMPPPDLIEELDDKWRFYHLCQALNVAVPQSTLVAPRLVDCERIAEEIGFPLVIKPLRLYGQRDIVYIPDARQLAGVFSTYPHKRAMVQRFIPGLDWGASVFALDGTITHRATFMCPDWVATKAAPHPDLSDAITRIIGATAYTGVANFDARVDDRTGQMLLFECNPRFFMRVTACRVLGVDFVRAGLGLPTGRVLDAGEFRGRQWSEVLRDPMPALLRRLWRIDCNDPAPFLAQRAN